MGYGTGVYRTTFLVFFLRGVTIGVVGASSLLIARRSGLPQNNLIAARGLGLTIGPAIFGRLIGRALWSGESQSCVSAALATKALCELVIPRATAATPLYTAFFTMGLAMALLDTYGDVLITRVHGERCAVPLNLINGVYGLGGMIAPFVAVGLDAVRVWDLLAGVDFLLAALTGLSRLCRGKPIGWKLKIRGLPGSPPASPTKGQPSEGLPPRVLRVGLAFILIAQASETAMSAWGFTFAATRLGQPDSVAAIFPATFYCSYTIGRFIVIPASVRALPSTIVQLGALLTLLGAVLLNAFTDTKEVRIRAVLLCVALVGAGTCPLFAMMMASLRQHGALTASQQGLYRTCSNLGNTMGMWLPGIVSLPRAECLWALALVLIVNSHVRAFPWWSRAPAEDV